MPRKSTTKETTKGQKKNSNKRTTKPVISNSKVNVKQLTKNPIKVIDEIETSMPAVEAKSAAPRTVKVHKLTLIIAFLIIVAGVLLYFGRGFIVAAVVNGQPITRLELIQESEKASGKQAMASLIRNTLVEQEARKKKVSVSDKEINDQIKTIESNLSKQGQKLDQMLILEGLTRNDLRKIVRLDVLITKLIGKDIKITDKEVNDYVEGNRDLLPKDKSEDQLKKDAKEALKREKLPQKAQAWFTDLEKNAKVVKFVGY